MRTWGTVGYGVCGEDSGGAMSVTKTKPLGVPDYLASPERAVALLNTVIASGGDLKEIR